MNIIAIIPARSGSKGVPGKNITPLAGYPLIAYSIMAAKMIPGVSRVIVSTDSEEYAAIAIKYGAEAPFIRPTDISNDKSTDVELFLHALNWFAENENYVPDYILHLRPTTPLRDPVIMNEALQLILGSKEATSLRSGHAAPESPFKWFLKDEQGYFKGLREDLTPELINLPRQSFPTAYISNGYIDILIGPYITKTQRLHGDKMMIFESPFCAQVDTKEDFNYLEYQIQKDGSVIQEQLQKDFPLN
jgi:CMP-N,N'-diacetyllegionaminic acid synthase